MPAIFYSVFVEGLCYLERATVLLCGQFKYPADDRGFVFIHDQFAPGGFAYFDFLYCVAEGCAPTHGIIAFFGDFDHATFGIAPEIFAEVFVDHLRHGFE